MIQISTKLHKTYPNLIAWRMHCLLES